MAALRGCGLLVVLVMAAALKVKQLLMQHHIELPPSLLVPSSSPARASLHHALPRIIDIHLCSCLRNPKKLPPVLAV